MSLKSILVGTDGSYEWTRVLGAFGVLCYILLANLFMGWSILVDGKAGERRLVRRRVTPENEQLEAILKGGAHGR